MARPRTQDREDDREVRRREIVAAARRLYASQPFSAITVAQIARAAGIAKGTVYLHFATKHELFVDVLLEEIDAYLEAIPAELTPATDGELDIERLAGEIAAAIASRHVLGRLLSILHIVLEQNLDLDAALRCKRALGDRLERTVEAFQPAMASISREDLSRFLLNLHAIIIGLHQATHPSPAVLDAVRHPGLSEMRLDFERELNHVLVLLLQGLATRSQRAH